MADIKTHLRELSVAITVGLLTQEIDFNLNDLYDSKRFIAYANKIVPDNISSAKNLESVTTFTGEMKQIVDNGYQLGKFIFENKYFNISKYDTIFWLGNDTQKDDPIDIIIGKYRFSLKEESFILENMGLYKLLNCYTGSNYEKRHIFNDYARIEYETWFSITWNELLDILNKGDGIWSYKNENKNKKSVISLDGEFIKFKYYKDGELIAKSRLPKECRLVDFENNTSSKTREKVFSKFINQNLDKNMKYNEAKKACAVSETKKLAMELNSNLNYNAGLPRFLRIHKFEYYYAKTTTSGIEIFKVPSLANFQNNIKIESIKSSVPDKQANILTTIINKKTGNKLVLRNECRFSHGQFNGTPEAKMYYEHGGSLEVIYEKI